MSIEGGHDAYSVAQDQFWGSVHSKLADLHEKYACERYNSAASLVDLPNTRVPRLNEVSNTLTRLTGFELTAAEAATSGRDFFCAFADGIFHASTGLRPADSPDYTSEPDLVHDLIGHAAILGDPLIAQLYRSFGKAASRTESDTEFTRIASLFWFTMETGLIIENGGVRAYGAAVLSSATEMRSFDNAEHRTFDVADILSQQINDKTCQSFYYVAESFEHIETEVRSCLDRF